MPRVSKSVGYDHESGGVEAGWDVDPVDAMGGGDEAEDGASRNTDKSGGGKERRRKRMCLLAALLLVLVVVAVVIGVALGRPSHGAKDSSAASAASASGVGQTDTGTEAPPEDKGGGDVAEDGSGITVDVNVNGGSYTYGSMDDTATTDAFSLAVFGRNDGRRARERHTRRRLQRARPMSDDEAIVR